MSEPAGKPRIVGRYALHGAIAFGGMATVHLARQVGAVGFSRTVAIKRPHPQFASDDGFVSMFLDEARLAARVRHPHVISTLDVVSSDGELFLVMEYVPGESLSRLAQAHRDAKTAIPIRILSAVMSGVLHGLHAAHEAKDEKGAPLGIVHRDISPQNVLVGADGLARVLDFGIAKAAGQAQATRGGQLKGKLAYMPREQLRGETVNCRSDIYAAGVVLWELVTGQRLFAAEDEGAIVAKVLAGCIDPPSEVLLRGAAADGREGPDESQLRALQDLDATILRALARLNDDRFPTARDMALEIERKVPPASTSEVADWVVRTAREGLAAREATVACIESGAAVPPGVQDDKEHVEPLFRTSVVPDSIVGLSTRPARVAATGSATGSVPRALQANERRLAAAALVGLMLVAGGLAVMLARSRAAAPPTIAAPSGEVVAAPRTMTTPPGLMAEPEITAAVAADAHGPTETGTSTATVRGATNKPQRPATAATSVARPPPPDCSRPSWFDVHGVKHYKKQCL